MSPLFPRVVQPREQEQREKDDVGHVQPRRLQPGHNVHCHEAAHGDANHVDNEICHRERWAALLRVSQTVHDDFHRKVLRHEPGQHAERDDRVHHVAQHAGAALVLANRGRLVLGVKQEKLRLHEEERGEQRGLDAAGHVVAHEVVRAGEEGKEDSAEREAHDHVQRCGAEPVGLHALGVEHEDEGVVRAACVVACVLQSQHEREDDVLHGVGENPGHRQLLHGGGCLVRGVRTVRERHAR